MAGLIIYFNPIKPVNTYPEALAAFGLFKFQVQNYVDLLESTNNSVDIYAVKCQLYSKHLELFRKTMCEDPGMRQIFVLFDNRNKLFCKKFGEQVYGDLVYSTELRPINTLGNFVLKQVQNLGYYHKLLPLMDHQQGKFNDKKIPENLEDIAVTVDGKYVCLKCQSKSLDIFIIKHHEQCQYHSMTTYPHRICSTFSCTKKSVSNYPECFECVYDKYRPCHMCNPRLDTNGRYIRPICFSCNPA